MLRSSIRGFSGPSGTRRSQQRARSCVNLVRNAGLAQERRGDAAAHMAPSHVRFRYFEYFYYAPPARPLSSWRRSSDAAPTATERPCTAMFRPKVDLTPLKTLSPLADFFGLHGRTLSLAIIDLGHY